MLKRLNRHDLYILLLLAALSCQCTTGDSEGDSSLSGAASDDPCAAEGRYGDGRCDLLCASADSDCNAADMARAALVADEITAANAWIDDDNLALKYCKMSQSPFSFYRGTNHLYWLDFAGDGRFATFGNERTRIWLQADLHAENFGAFDNDEGTVVYDLNDFDESIIADYQWDVWRMAISIVLVARADQGFSDGKIDSLVDAFVEAYLDALADYRGNDDEKSVQITAKNGYGLLDDFLSQIEQDNNRALLLNKWTDKDGGVRTFDLSLAKLAPVDPMALAMLDDQMAIYAASTGGDLSEIPGYFTIKDVARRLDAGTGSLGVPRYYVLIEGDSDSTGDDRILDVKGQLRPTAYPFLSAEEQLLLDDAAANDAERAVVAYRALSRKADDHLGWLTLSDGVYSVRDLSPYKEPFPLALLTSEGRFEKLAEQWGTILATAHARADRDHNPAVIDYSFDSEVDALTDTFHAEFRAQVRDLAHSYAEQVRFDHQAFLAMLGGSAICP